MVSAAQGWHLIVLNHADPRAAGANMMITIADSWMLMGCPWSLPLCSMMHKGARQDRIWEKTLHPEMQLL